MAGDPPLRWELEPAVELPDPASIGYPEDPDTTQWLPMITVDPNGDVHVIYYDDLMFSQLYTDTEAKYDLAYAVSRNKGQSYTITRWSVPGGNAAWLDTNLLDDGPTTWEIMPREYNGLTFWPVGNGTVEVWAAFCGTDVGDTLSSVIWAFREDSQ